MAISQLIVMLGELNCFSFRIKNPINTIIPVYNYLNEPRNGDVDGATNQNMTALIFN